MDNLLKQIQDQQKQIDALILANDTQKQDIENLKIKRMYQMDYTPDSVKQRAMGEGNRFVRSGTSGNLPVKGETVKTNSSTIYYETDTFKFKAYDLASAAWKSVTLS